MIFKYKILWLMIIIFNVCIVNLSIAQIADQDSVVIKEVPIVNIAFGSQPSKEVTSAVSTVNGNQLSNVFTPNLANTLVGRLSGLTVSQSTGEPGYDSPILNARGLSTFGTGNSLYIVVDGFKASIEQLMPDEIESITLLKDASATAIYGNKGANGVLLVTTKRGNKGALKVNFGVQQGFQSAMRLPKFLGSYDYARLYNEGLVNDGKSTLYTDKDLEAYRTGINPLLYPDINWYDHVLRKMSPISNYDLNFSGGNNTVRYFALLNIMSDGGLYKRTGDLSEFSKNSNYRRYNFRTNIDLNLSKRLSAAISLSGSVEDKSNPGINETTDNEFNLMASIPPNAFPIRIPGGLFGGNSLYSNPLADILNTGYYTSNSRTATVAVKLTEQLDWITKGLNISAAVSFNNYFRTYSYKTRQYARFAVAQNTAGDTVYTKIGQNTSLSGNESLSNQWRNYGLQGFLNYNRTFGRHKIDLMVMTNMDSYAITASGGLPYKNVGLGGRLNYVNSDKYICEFSVGYNGTENFPRGKRFGYFPAASLGWIISNEEFLKKSDFISYLKIRGSYGLVGNADIGGLRFMFDQYFGSSGSYYFGTANTVMSTLVQGIQSNPEVTWEKEKKANVGFEATFFKRLDVSLDLFKEDRYDILAKPYLSVPQYLGITLPDLNVGKVHNEGFEAMVRFNSNDARKLQFFVEANAWYARNKVVYNAEAIQQFAYLSRTGRMINQPFLLEAIGFFKDQSDINSSPRQIFTTVQPGDIKYKDQNGDNVIDQNDYYPSGYSKLPQITFGFHAGIKYKGFDLDAFFQGVTNRSVYWSGNYFYAFQNNAKISSIALGRWTPETASIATYPRLSANNNLNNFQPSTFWQHDGSYIKLRSIELGYSLSKKMANKIKLTNARIFINGTNLFSLDHMDGFTDPEILTGYPAVRTYSMGIKIQL